MGWVTNTTQQFREAGGGMANKPVGSGSESHTHPVEHQLPVEYLSFFQCMHDTI